MRWVQTAIAPGIGPHREAGSRGSKAITRRENVRQFRAKVRCDWAWSKEGQTGRSLGTEPAGVLTPTACNSLCLTQACSHAPDLWAQMPTCHPTGMLHEGLPSSSIPLAPLRGPLTHLHHPRALAQHLSPSVMPGPLLATSCLLRLQVKTVLPPRYPLAWPLCSPNTLAQVYTQASCLEARRWLWPFQSPAPFSANAGSLGFLAVSPPAVS